MERQILRLLKRKMASEEKKSEQEVCPFLEYTKASGPGVYHLGGLWCIAVAFRRKVNEKQAVDFCLNPNFEKCFVIQLIRTERRASINRQMWSSAKLREAKKWLSKHQSEN